MLGTYGPMTSDACIYDVIHDGTGSRRRRPRSERSVAHRLDLKAPPPRIEGCRVETVSTTALSASVAELLGSLRSVGAELSDPWCRHVVTTKQRTENEMTSLAGKYAFRDELSRRMIADLVGPAGGTEEVIDDAPITRYVAGILYPAGGGWSAAGLADAAQDIDENDGYDEVVNPDPAVAMANVRNPASMGLSFAVRAADCDHVRVTVEAARYTPLPLENDEDGTALEARSDVDRTGDYRCVQASAR